MTVINFKQFRRYDDYRIEQYCRNECPFVIKKENGQLFCRGKFRHKGNYYSGRGLECDKIINFCFNDDTTLEE